MELAGLNSHVKDSVKVTNPDGDGAYVFTCDHASNVLPPEYGTLGLPESDLSRHIAWDPGALPVAQQLAAALDAPLIETCISRLVLDCNRPLDAPDLIPAVSETTVIPGNRDLSSSERERRIAQCWRPFHQAVEAVIEQRLKRGQETRLVSIHSFTPTYKDIVRPWQIGVIHDEDTRLSEPMAAALGDIEGLTLGLNEPYAPEDRVYFTLEQHARRRGLPCAMIEIRNDEIRDDTGQRTWAERLIGILRELGLAKLPKPPPFTRSHSMEGII
jgi:predicted N-formylglutamate amidohydrolase